MHDKNHNIKKGYSFNSIEGKDALLDKETAMAHYANKLESAINLNDSIPVFLDTNVLLRGYSVSPERRGLLNKFFSERIAQIVITKQVQQEFVRLRKRVKKTYANQPDSQLTDVGDALANLLLELGPLPEETENSKVVNDELSDLFPNFKQIDNLSASEKTFLKKEFDVLASAFNPKKIKEELKKSNKVFPGMGDILEKPKFPYGDYFLYHEMLKYSYESNQDVVFLTFDVAKGDWLKQNKKSYPHYIYKTFALNEKVIFIIDANSFFKELYDTSFDPLVPVAPVAKKEEHYVVKSGFEKKLAAQFGRLERSIRKLAQKLDVDTTNDISAKYILDELNYDDHISNGTYYELVGIWSIKDGLAEGDLETIRRQYSPNELEEVLTVVRDNVRVIDKLLL